LVAIDLDFVGNLFSIRNTEAAMPLRDSENRTTAAQEVPDPFQGETVNTCVTTDSFTAFHYMRKEV